MKKSGKHLCFPDFFIAPKSKISYAECKAFRHSQRATLSHPDMNVGLVIITDINLFQKPHYTPSYLE